jgi:hypothetical protein
MRPGCATKTSYAVEPVAFHIRVTKVVSMNEKRSDLHVSAGIPVGEIALFGSFLYLCAFLWLKLTLSPLRLRDHVTRAMCVGLLGCGDFDGGSDDIADDEALDIYLLEEEEEDHEEETESCAGALCERCGDVENMEDLTMCAAGHELCSKCSAAALSLCRRCFCPEECELCVALTESAFKRARGNDSQGRASCEQPMCDNCIMKSNLSIRLRPRAAPARLRRTAASAPPRLKTKRLRAK